MEKIFYLSNDVTAQSQIAAAIAKIKYPEASMQDTAGLDNTAMEALVTAMTDAVYDDVIIAMPLVDAHAAGKFTNAQAVTLIPKLKVANQGTDVTGTCQANSTVTAIKLAASGPSAVNDFYNLRIIATAGVTAVTRLITDYVGATKVCTVATTTTAITTTETYIVYMTDNIRVVGHTYQGSGTGNPAYTTFKNLFPTAQLPWLVHVLSGVSVFTKDDLTASAVAAGTIAKTSEFVSGAYDGKDYYVAIKSATTGGGQVRKILSGNATTLTLTENWAVTPTGTVVFQVKEGSNLILADLCMVKAIASYLSENNGETWVALKKMLDRYGDLYRGELNGHQDISLVEYYYGLGNVIMTAKWKGVVS